MAASAIIPSIILEDKKSMLKRSIPSSGELIPVIGLGTWIQFDVGSSEPERQPLKQVLLKMKELGGKVIDSSPMYGNAETVVGDLTAELGISNDFFIATKVWTQGEKSGLDQMQSSMKKLKRETIDLMQVHNLVDWKIHLKTMRSLQERGKIRYIGITHYVAGAHAELEKIIQSEKIDFVQFNYSIRERNAEKSLLQTAYDKKVAVIINEPFEKAALFKVVKGKSLPKWAAEYDIKTWAQFFLKYLISHPAVTCVIPGTSDAEHVADNMLAGCGRMPDESGRLKMVEHMQNL